MRDGFFSSLSRVRWGITRFPLDAAADARPLSAVDWCACEQSLDRRAEIATGHRFAIAGTTVVQLPTIDEPTVTIKDIKVRGAGCAIGFRDLLRLVVTEWKGKAEPLRHFF